MVIHIGLSKSISNCPTCEDVGPGPICATPINVDSVIPFLEFQDLCYMNHYNCLNRNNRKKYFLTYVLSKLFLLYFCIL